jgi:haloacetate dehalogenase
MHIPGLNRTTIDLDGVSIHLAHGGQGPPLLLLHGFPQTHLIWRHVAPVLARSFHVVCADLRGYGDSSKPAGGEGHVNYAKRAMAADMAGVMAKLGYHRFAVAGHDRGGRVAHRLALDRPDAVTRLCVMDIAPTLHMFESTDQAFATGYYHWFFLIQRDRLPEHMIGADPAWYLREKLKQWAAPAAHFEEEVVAEYIRCFSPPQAVHAACEDYRAAATIDLEHDRADRAQGRRVACPLLALWGARGFIGRTYDVRGVWRQYATHVEGRALDCGHYLPEEQPAAVIDELSAFFAAEARGQTETGAYP